MRRVLPTLVSGGRAQAPLRKCYHHSALKQLFYHHLIFKMVFLPRFGLKNVQTDQILTTTQSSLGRTLYVRYASIVVLRAHWLPRYTHAAQMTIMHTTHQNASESEFPHILHQWASLGRDGNGSTRISI